MPLVPLLWLGLGALAWNSIDDAVIDPVTRPGGHGVDIGVNAQTAGLVILSAVAGAYLARKL